MFDTPIDAQSPIAEGDVLRAGELAGIEGIRHAFFTRRGGVSTDIYHGLNVGIGSQDAPDAVRQNRRRALDFLKMPGEDVATPWQVHSPDVTIATGPFGAERPRADGIVTATPGLAIGVVTADCGPVLFADRRGGVVGAAHAGWRGALGGVLEATIDAMEGLGARRSDIVAVLGPSITAPNYEVGTEMEAGFLARDPGFARFFTEGATADKRQFDMPGFIVSALDAAGVQASFVGRCTYGEPGDFFSYRRTTHRGEADYGRQLSAIALATGLRGN